MVGACRSEAVDLQEEKDLRTFLIFVLLKDFFFLKFLMQKGLPTSITF